MHLQIYNRHSSHRLYLRLHSCLVHLPPPPPPPLLLPPLSLHSSPSLSLVRYTHTSYYLADVWVPPPPHPVSDSYLSVFLHSFAYKLKPTAKKDGGKWALRSEPQQ